MTNRVSKLILAAVLLSSVPLAASADGRDFDRERDPPAGWPAPASPPAYPGPGAYPVPPPVSDGRDGRDWREGRDWRDGRDWREAREWRWRARERVEVMAQLRALDGERARFYAENGWRPGRVRRFERFYAMRRAELERRLYELQPVAWR